MQTLARNGLTDSQVRDLIMGANTDVEAGVDLLDLDDVFIRDLSDSVTSCTVTWNGYAPIHRGIDLTVTEPLDWPNVRVRPWQSVGAARFDLGVFGLQIPESDDESGVYQVQGGDKLTILQRLIGDTYWVAKSAPGALTYYAAAARQAIVDSGLTGTASQIDSSADAVELVDDLVWALDLQAPASYLRVVNDCLAQIGYRALWMTPDGAPRSVPYRKPIERPEEWHFVSGANALTSEIVLPKRSIMSSTWARPDAWRFVRNGSATLPTEGAGLYTVGDWDAADAVRAVYGIDASSQAVLESRGDQQVITDSSRTRLINISTAPLPCLDHFDIVRYTDPAMGVDVKCQVRSWTQRLNLSGSSAPVDLVLEVVDDDLA